ncbi:RHS repeat domain-containing protein, partial [Neorhodopirellula pilleata]|uniref:RHS repeat domain-containing protein n=1 Tax=Neorhodopirellula pilleata TaxID=2714738 RepID=UPI0011B3DF98
MRRRGRLPTACHPPTQNTFQNTKRQYHRNQQYSITAITNGGGSITERYAYDAYGGMTVLDASLSPLTASAEGNRYTYTSREFDEDLGLYHYRARMYDADAGRFCSKDPIGYEGSPGNLYCYALDSPISSVDPSGLCAVEPRPEQECCDEAKAAGMSDGDAGGLVCCDGRKVSCVWISTGYLIGHPDRPTEPTAIKIIDECVKKH